MKLKIVDIQEPRGPGQGEVTGRNADNQAVKITVNNKDWHLFADADIDLGDAVYYDPDTRAWRRA